MGRGRLTEDNVKDTLREVRMALLEADVALPVVREFINRVKEKAVGHEVNKSLTPGQEFVKIVRNELVAAMGEENQTLNLAAQPPAVVLMAGLQGAGKTTSVGKLGKFLREKHKKKVLVVSADVYRPAAIKQLETLAEQVGVDFFPSDVGQKPVDIVNAALKEAKLKFYDVLLVDTAGRLHVDEAMMDEIKQVHASINPVETLFVVDAMTGQDAANTAKAFNEALPLTGVVLTKVDGDAAAVRRSLFVTSLANRSSFSVLARKLRRWSVPSGPHRVAYSRHGRRTVADRRYRKQKLTARRQRN
ncbi:signal recognition particle protein [Escherichia coli]|uniref:Signal recognition particle protein n=1 Tax=Escherichia coli TaxID=562 RepID=A0A376KPL9_ECOLX|nr:signal recognition particle protein [Escherichia coli]